MCVSWIRSILSIGQIWISWYFPFIHIWSDVSPQILLEEKVIFGGKVIWIHEKPYNMDQSEVKNCQSKSGLITYPSRRFAAAFRIKFQLPAMACKAWSLAAAYLSNFILHLSTHQLCCSHKNFLRVAWAPQTPFCLRISAQAAPLAEGLLPVFTWLVLSYHSGLSLFLRETVTSCSRWSYTGPLQPISQFISPNAAQ